MARRAQPPRKSFPVFSVVVGLVVVIGVVAVIVSRGSESDKKSTPAGVDETRSVIVGGTALPDFDSKQLPDPAVGKAIPVLRGASFDGTPVSITNDGKGKVIMFVAHWCPHCQREVPLITQYLASNQPPAGVELYGVSTNVQSGAPNYPPSAWLTCEHWPVRTLADDGNSSAAGAFGLTGFPYFVATDASGKVVARTSGEITMDQFAALMNKAAGAPS